MLQHAKSGLTGSLHRAHKVIVRVVDNVDSRNDTPALVAHSPDDYRVVPFSIIKWSPFSIVKVQAG